MYSTTTKRRFSRHFPQLSFLGQTSLIGAILLALAIATPLLSTPLAAQDGTVKAQHGEWQIVCKKPAGAKKETLLKENWAEIFQPLDDRLLVLVDTSESMSPGGLYIPDTAKAKPKRGQVVSVGRGKMNKKGRILPMDVVCGDSVLFNAFDGATITVQEQEFLLLRETEVLGVVLKC